MQAFTVLIFLAAIAFQVLLTSQLPCHETAICNADESSEYDSKECCNCFNEYECPSPKQLRYDEGPVCNNDTVFEVTMELIDKGDSIIRYTESGDAIMIIGLTGVGKSTLTYFVAGNMTDLYSSEAMPDEYSIGDCNENIGGGYISATIFPDLVEDFTLGATIAYYDNPGFQDNRGACTEIANSYFMKQVTARLTRVKIVLVVDYKLIQDRGMFSKIFNSVLLFVPNITEYTDAISLVATKVGNGGSSDSVYVEAVGKSLHSFVEETPELTEENRIKIRTVVNSLTAKRSKIALFRMPIQCGLFSDQQHMIDNRNHIRAVIGENTAYANIIGDFGTSLSAENKNTLIEFSRIMLPSTAMLVVEFTNIVAQEIRFDCAQNCESVFTSLSRLFGYEQFATGYLDSNYWNPLNYTQIVNEILNEKYLPLNLHVPEDIVANLIAKAKYLDFFSSYIVIESGSTSLIPSMQSFSRRINDEVEMFFDNFNIRTWDLLLSISIELKGNILMGLCDDNVYQRRGSVINATIETSARITSLQTFINNGIKLGDFLEKVLGYYFELGLSESDQTLELQARIKLTRSFITYNLQTEILNTTKEYWVQGLTSITEALDRERRWNEFVIDTFEVTRGSSVQLEHEQILQVWLKGKTIDLSNFAEFFQTIEGYLSDSKGFTEAELTEILKELGTEFKIPSLNRLLDATLRPVDDPCIATGEITICKGNFLSLNSPRISFASKTVIITVYDTLFIEESIIGSELDATVNKNLIIVAPNIWIKNDAMINLDGADAANQTGIGQPGLPGSTGGKSGNAIVITQAPSGYGSLKLFANGGRGGDGQTGVDGIAGKIGEVKEFIASSHCAARKGGWIRISQHPYTCCDHTYVIDDLNTECKAGNSGCSYEVYGTKGSSGTMGYDGGKGGPGGSMGTILLFCLDSEKCGGRISASATSAGSNGTDGNGGSGGAGGHDGQTVKVSIDDVFHQGQKICEFSGKRLASGKTYSSGSNGISGGNSANMVKPTPNVFDAQDFAQFLDDYVTVGKEIGMNEYFSTRLNPFITKIENTEGIPRLG